MRTPFLTLGCVLYAAVLPVGSNTAGVAVRLDGTRAYVPNVNSPTIVDDTTKVWFQVMNTSANQFPLTGWEH